MRFFMNRHYSTAQKIIDSVESKIRAALNKHPEIIECERVYEVSSVTRSVIGKRKLAEILGDTLKSSLPDTLYDKYQRLNEHEKKELREKVANDYFQSLLARTDLLKNIKIYISAESDRWGTYYVCAEISLPKVFLDKDKLSHELRHSMSLVKKELILAENNPLQSPSICLS